MKIILASASPRRAEILKKVGVIFSVIPTDADETVPDTFSPHEAVCEISRRKAAALTDTLDLTAKKETFVIAADTVVAVGNEILGKPKDAADASRMMHLLSGTKHAVFTGYTLVCGDKILTDFEKTEVIFRDLSEEEIDRYTKTSEPMDKAGAYGVQETGALFVKGIVGDYYNVMGFPICAICEKAKEIFGMELPLVC